MGFTLPLLEGVPRTIEFKQIDWDSSHWTETYTTSGVIATSSDRSRTNVVQQNGRWLNLLPASEHAVHTIYLSKLQTAYVIDHQQHTVLVVPCRCSWSVGQLWPQDDQCLAVANLYVYAGVPVKERVGQIAGFPVIWYRWIDHSRVQEFAFAPTLQCEVMEEVRIELGKFGLPNSYSRFMITKYVPGEPRPDVFTPPSAYQFQKHPTFR